MNIVFLCYFHWLSVVQFFKVKFIVSFHNKHITVCSLRTKIKNCLCCISESTSKLNSHVERICNENIIVGRCTANARHSRL